MRTLSSAISVSRDERVDSSPSSKGNQIKWRTRDGFWLKADDLGYEGLSEAVASELLKGSNIQSHVPYAPCIINEESVEYRGCVSDDFLAPGESLITIYRLLETNGYNADALFDGKSAPEKLRILIETVTSIAKLPDFGKWLGRLFEFDAFILNEDRHLHNIALIIALDEQFRFMPVFDNGAAFLSDTRRDYPLTSPTFRLIDKVRGKPIATHFEKQIGAVRDVIGLSLRLDHSACLESEAFNRYREDEIGRVKQVIEIQSSRYPYLYS